VTEQGPAAHSRAGPRARHGKWGPLALSAQQPKPSTSPRPPADTSRDYLAQRAYSAVLYLGTQGDNFTGGTLRFRRGSPADVAPTAGRLVAYTAGGADEHCVSPVRRGAREALTVWFTEDPAHAQDTKVRLAAAGAPSSGVGGPLGSGFGRLWRRCAGARPS
jgi:hypothetical protein